MKRARVVVAFGLSLASGWAIACGSSDDSPAPDAAAGEPTLDAGRDATLASGDSGPVSTLSDGAATTDASVDAHGDGGKEDGGAEDGGDGGAEDGSSSDGGAPAAAAAAGFHHLVFDDEFTSATTITTSTSAMSGYKWYPFEFDLATAANISVNTGAGTGALAGATGILTLDGGNIGTTPTYPPNDDPIAGSFGHAYFEARIQFTPQAPSTKAWPAFWSFGISAFDHDAAGYSAENDFFEPYPTSTGIDPIETLHNWKHDTNGSTGTDTGNTNNQNRMVKLVGSDASAAPLDGAWHTIGSLWVQTSSTTGYIEYYLDNFLVVHDDGTANGISRYLTGAGTKFTQQELDHMIVILGGAPGWPLNVDWVRVWQ